MVVRNTDAQVFVRATERGQDTFTLIAQDASAPATIAFWMLQNILTAPPWKLRDALEHALRMRDYQPRKNAD